MTKEFVPEDFTLGLTLFDALPVIFFGLSAIFIGLKLKSTLFTIDATICLVSGICKVLWKLIVCTMKKNVWILSFQMRFLMPVGFLLMIVSFILLAGRINFAEAFKNLCSFPYIIFFGIGILGMILMGVFGFALDSSKLKTNWIEQITNAIAQGSIFLGILLYFLRS